jgi:hypothetical protein
MIGLEVEHRKGLWNIAFVNCGYLSEDERIDLIKQVADAYLDSKIRANLKGEGFEGLMQYKGIGMLNGFIGPRFEGILETEKGKSDFDFIVYRDYRNALN